MVLCERHFLGLYRPFPIGELAAGGSRRDRAVWVMEQIPFEDTEVGAAIVDIGGTSNV